MGRLHRNERSGTLTGLFRVRQFTQDDAHIYCRPDQLQDEITGVLELVREWYKTFGLEPSLPAGHAAREVPRARRSSGTRPRRRSTRRCGPTGWPTTSSPATGPSTGPRSTSTSRTRSGGTGRSRRSRSTSPCCPSASQLEYIDADGQPKRPVAIHRAIFGSFERFIGILTEHFAGAFPTWLAPVQARVLPVSAKHVEYAAPVHRRLRGAGSARSSTTATRSSATTSATPRSARCRTCWSWASARPSEGTASLRRGAARTRARCRSTASSPSSRPRSGPGPLASRIGLGTRG